MREKMPDIAVTSDIIVAFPGETEADFEDTLTMLRRVRFGTLELGALRRGEWRELTQQEIEALQAL